MSHVLLVEDEEHLAETLAFNLRNVGYDVTLAATAPRALELLVGPGARRFDLTILDLMLPGGDGLQIAREMRRSRNLSPILVLTARHLTEDMVAALDAGADDFLTKPFELDELLARVRVLLRRQAWHRAYEEGEGRSAVLEFGACRVNFASLKAVGVGERKLELSRTEALLMRLLAEHQGQPVSRARILEEVWGAPGDLSTRSVDNFIMRLRRYFEADPKRPRHIVTVRGTGYMFQR